MRPFAGVAVMLLVTLAGVPWLPVARPSAAAPRLAGPSLRAREIDVDAAVVIDLAAAALAGGSSVPDALLALGEVLGGALGAALRRAGALLLLGASWPEAWAGAPPEVGALRHALEPAWVDGAPPGPLLTQSADRLRAEQAQLAREAAGRLGVRLVLPLGLCFLPAFVLLGLVPVLVSAGNFLR